jgi:hypothetical protein
MSLALRTLNASASPHRGYSQCYQCPGAQSCVKVRSLDSHCKEGVGAIGIQLVVFPVSSHELYTFRHLRNIVLAGALHLCAWKSYTVREKWMRRVIFECRPAIASIGVALPFPKLTITHARGPSELPETSGQWVSRGALHASKQKKKKQVVDQFTLHRRRGSEMYLPQDRSQQQFLTRLTISVLDGRARGAKGW